MDTLSSSVASLQVPSLPSTPRELHGFKPSAAAGHIRFIPGHQPTITAGSLSRKATTVLRRNNHPSPLFPSCSQLNPSARAHRKPATGYAAALLQISQSSDSLLAMRKDVRKLFNRLRHREIQALLTDPTRGREEKGLVMKAVAGSGGLNRRLVGLAEMLVDREKVEMVGEALEEFLRIFDELIGRSDLVPLEMQADRVIDKKNWDPITV